MPATATHDTGTAGERKVAMAATASIVNFRIDGGFWKESGLVETRAIVVQQFRHQALVELVNPPAPYAKGEQLVLDNERLVLA